MPKAIAGQPLSYKNRYLALSGKNYDYLKQGFCLQKMRKQFLVKVFACKKLRKQFLVKVFACKKVRKQFLVKVFACKKVFYETSTSITCSLTMSVSTPEMVALTVSSPVFETLSNAIPSKYLSHASA